MGREFADRRVSGITYGKPERARVVVEGGHHVAGWRVVVSLHGAQSNGASQHGGQARYAFLLHKRKLGFAVIALGHRPADHAAFTWKARSLSQVDKDLARLRERQARRRMRAREKRPPTAAELATADFGAAPRRYEQAIRDHLGAVRKLPESMRLFCQPPRKSWGRAKGSLETVYGWRVTVKVEGGKVRHFMFHGEEIVSNKRAGQGFELTAAGPAR